MRLSLVLLITLAALQVRAQTQSPAPIERLPPQALPSAPQPQPTQAQVRADKDWEKLIHATHYSRPEVRIQAVGDPLRCDVEKVTPDEIFCTEHRAGSGFLENLIHPREQYHVPRREIRDVRVGGRELSTLLGTAVGIGVGVGIGSINEASRADGGQVYGALLCGVIGALIGHSLPFAGHPVYQQP